MDPITFPNHIEIKEGDVVHLNSGGPPMTVNFFFESMGQFECYWFDGEILRKGLFSEDSVAKEE